MLAATLLAGACTGGDEKQPENAGGDQQAGQQVDPGVAPEYRDKAIAHGRDRQIDACGLHDPAAAEKATGDKGDEIVPGSAGLHECTLRMKKSEFDATWRFNVEAGAVFDAGYRKTAAPEKIGGLDIFINEDADRCEIAKPIDDTYAVVMTANAPSGKDKPAKAPCQVLREYVTALAPIWKDLPKRGSGRTAPEFTLTKLDPCAAAATALDMFSEPYLETSNPSTCTARSRTPAPPQQRPKGVGRDEVTVTWTMDDDPAKMVRADAQGSREVTVEGHKAVISKGSNGCTTTIVWDPDITVVADNLNPENETLTQQIRVYTATCDNAEQIAQKIVAKVGHK